MQDQNDRYGADVLAGPRVTGKSYIAAQTAARNAAAKAVAAVRGLVVEEDNTGWVGAITRVQNVGGIRTVELEDRFGKVKSFALGNGFSIDGQPVILTHPVAMQTAPKQPTLTASGSRAVKMDRARVARGSRIWVEGKHDAQLIEKVWGADLRVEGVVVEELDGVDNLATALQEFAPTADRRVGVLVDHLLPGTKEQRVATEALRNVPRETVLILGHPYVDVWQAVKPERIGLPAWPEITRGTEWKLGVLAHLGWPRATPADIGLGWQRILNSVRDYRDLEPALLGRVEELIDFVTLG